MNFLAGARREVVGRDNNFNFLRLSFAMLVILSHSAELIDGSRVREPLSVLFGTLTFAELAVNGFFILSGYLIVQSWQHSFHLLDFLKKRVLRIYPAFIVASLVSVCIVGYLGADGHYFSQLNPLRVVKTALLLGMPQTPPTFEGTPHPFVNGPLWTIAFEFRCYLLVGLLGALGIFSRPLLWLALTGLAVLLTGVSFLQPEGWANGFRFPGSDLLIGSPQEFVRLFSCFGAGGCFYLFRDRFHYRWQWALPAVIILILSLFHFTTAYLAVATMGAYCLFGFAFARIPALDRFKMRTDISYGLYLYGWPVQKLLHWYVPTLSPPLLFFSSLVGAALCGWLSWHCVEAPFLKLKKQTLARTPSEPPPDVIRT